MQNKINKGTAMYKYFYLFLILSLFVIGCSEESSVLSPVNTVSSEPNWITLPKANGMLVETNYTANRKWDGKKAGVVISIDESYAGGPYGTVTIKSSLWCDRNSYSGVRTISVTLDDASTVATFSPAQVFDKPLKYTVTYTGIDLSNINPATIKFAYIGTDGSIQYAVNEGIAVNLSTGTLAVKNAKIPHFSRYGFVN